MKGLVLVLTYISVLSSDLKHHSKFLLNFWASFFLNIYSKSLNTLQFLIELFFFFSCWDMKLYCRWQPLLKVLDLQIFPFEDYLFFSFFILLKQCLVMKSGIAPECWNYSHWVITLVRNTKLIKSNFFIDFLFCFSCFGHYCCWICQQTHSTVDSLASSSWPYMFTSRSLVSTLKSLDYFCQSCVCFGQWHNVTHNI